MTIEGLGKKFQEARLARNLTLDEAARMTKIRPSRLAEIEADDFSQFPSLAYAKGFLLIYGKFLDVDVSPYLEAFETSEQMTVDGYSYLQDNPAPKPVRAPIVRRRRSSPSAASSSDRTSLMPLFLGLGVLVIGFLLMKFILDIQRIAPRKTEPVAQASPAAPPSTPASILATPATTPHIAANKVVSAPASPSSSATPPIAANKVVSAPAPPSSSATPPIAANKSASTPAPVVPSTPPQVAANKVVSAPPGSGPSATAAPIAARTAPPATAAPTSPPAIVAKSSSPPPSPAPADSEPEVRRAEPVRAEDLTKAVATESTGANRIAIRPLKKTYIKVVVDNEAAGPAFERWVSPGDGTVEFKGQHIAVRVLDRGAIQIKKNGKLIADGDADVTIE
jgi:cytoskeletal protein RodZ